MLQNRTDCFLPSELGSVSLTHLSIPASHYQSHHRLHDVQQQLGCSTLRGAVETQPESLAGEVSDGCSKNWSSIGSKEHPSK
jgi:hypothetical protein